MPNDNLDSNNQAASLTGSPMDKPSMEDVKSVRPRRAPKPLVEGINSPAASSLAPVADTEPLLDEPETLASNIIAPKVTLTEAEKVLVGNPSPVQVTSVSQPAPAKPSPAPATKQTIFPPDFTGQKIILPAPKTVGNKVAWGILITLFMVSLVFGALLWYDNQTGTELSQLWKVFSKTKKASPAPQQNVVVVPPQNLATTTQPVVVPSASSTPDVPITKNTQITVQNTPTGYLNVRSLPSTSGKLLTRIHPGEIYTYTEVKNNWYKIVLSDGSSGWVTGQYAKVLTATK